MFVLKVKWKRKEYVGSDERSAETSHVIVQWLLYTEHLNNVSGIIIKPTDAINAARQALIDRMIVNNKHLNVT